MDALSGVDPNRQDLRNLHNSFGIDILQMQLTFNMQATNKQDLPADNGTVAEPLFANVRVSFVLGRDLDEDRSEEVGG